MNPAEPRWWYHLPANAQAAILFAGVICTLGIYSILYRENRLYRMFEHVFVGLAMGYGIFVTWRDVLLPKWYSPLIDEAKWYWMIAVPFSALFYLIYSKRLVWMSRWWISTMFGLGAGLAFKGFVNDQFPQIKRAIQPIHHTVVKTGFGHYFEMFNSVVMLITLLCVMTYFFFSFEHRARPMQGAAKTGRWLMMVTFGAIFGSTVMGRVSLFIGRMQFLLTDWLHLSKYGQ